MDWVHYGGVYEYDWLFDAMRDLRGMNVRSVLIEDSNITDLALSYVEDMLRFNSRVRVVTIDKQGCGDMGMDILESMIKYSKVHEINLPGMEIDCLSVANALKDNTTLKVLRADYIQENVLIRMLNRSGLEEIECDQCYDDTDILMVLEALENSNLRSFKSGDFRVTYAQLNYLLARNTTLEEIQVYMLDEGELIRPIKLISSN